DGSVKICETANGRLISNRSAHIGSVWSVAFSSDGAWLASAGDDRMIRVLERATSRELPALQGHRLGISSLTFSKRNHRLVSVSSDKTAIIWDVTRAKEVTRLSH